MRITRFTAGLALAVLATSFMGCASTITTVGGANRLVDDAYAADSHISSQTASALDMPATLVGAVWNDPQTEFPGYLAQVVDPYNYPHMLWRAFYTVWTVPINPLYHVTRGPVESYDSYVSPVRETIAYNFTPTPHGGNGTLYMTSRFNAHTRHFEHIWDQVKYHLLNTNSSLPPYDRFYPEQWQQDKTLIHYTFDNHLFGYDWDDPYVD